MMDGGVEGVCAATVQQAARQTERPSITRETLLRALLLQAAILGAQRTDVDGTGRLQPAVPRFVGLNMDDPIWEVTFMPRGPLVKDPPYGVNSKTVPSANVPATEGSAHNDFPPRRMSALHMARWPVHRSARALTLIDVLDADRQVLVARDGREASGSGSPSWRNVSRSACSHADRQRARYDSLPQGLPGQEIR